MSMTSASYCSISARSTAMLFWTLGLQDFPGSPFYGQEDL